MSYLLTVIPYNIYIIYIAIMTASYIYFIPNKPLSDHNISIILTTFIIFEPGKHAIRSIPLITLYIHIYLYYNILFSLYTFIHNYNYNYNYNYKYNYNYNNYYNYTEKRGRSPAFIKC